MSNSDGKGARTQATQRSGAPTPDLIDSLIVILVSSAVVIFLFWVASRSLNIDTFEVLPDFITKSFAGIWASAASGATGVGLAIYKGLTRSDQPRPNYLLWIGGTAAAFLLSVFLLLHVLRQVGPSTSPSKPRISPALANAGAEKNTPQRSVVKPLMAVKKSPTLYDFTLVLRNDTSAPQFYSNGHSMVPLSYRSGMAEFRLGAGSYSLKADYANWTCTAFVSLPLEDPGPVAGDCKLK